MSAWFFTHADTFARQFAYNRTATIETLSEIQLLRVSTCF
jgi:hypothetical protein